MLLTHKAICKHEVTFPSPGDSLTEPSISDVTSFLPLKKRKLKSICTSPCEDLVFPKPRGRPPSGKKWDEKEGCWFPCKPTAKPPVKTVERPVLRNRLTAIPKRSKYEAIQRQRARECSNLTNQVDSLNNQRVRLSRDRCVFLEIHGPNAGISTQTLRRIRMLTDEDNWDGWLYHWLTPSERWKFFSQIQPFLVKVDYDYRSGRRITRSSHLPIDVASDMWEVTGGPFLEVLKPFNDSSSLFPKVRLRFLNNEEANDRLTSWVRARERRFKKSGRIDCSRYDFLKNDTESEDNDVDDVEVVGESSRHSKIQKMLSAVQSGIALQCGIDVVDITSDGRDDAASVISVEAEFSPLGTELEAEEKPSQFSNSMDVHSDIVEAATTSAAVENVDSDNESFYDLNDCGDDDDDYVGCI